MYEPVLLRVPVDWEPLRDLPPDQLPEAVQEFALLELQFNVDDAPDNIDVGFAEILTVGGARPGSTEIVVLSTAVQSSEPGWPRAIVVPARTTKLPPIASGELDPKI